MDKGPSELDSSEVDDTPSPHGVLATVEWSVTTDNVEMADFIFEYNDAVSEHLQLIGSHYNLTGLAEDHLNIAQDILEGWTMEDEDLEPDDRFEPPALTVGIDATVDEHQDLVSRILTEVYDTSLGDVERLSRSTVTSRSAADYEPEDVVELPSITCGTVHQAEPISDSSNPYYSIVGGPVDAPGILMPVLDTGVAVHLDSNSVEADIEWDKI